MKKVFFVGKIIPSDIFKENFDECKMIQDGAANVYYNAILYGLSKNAVEVSCRTILPQSCIKEPSFSRGNIHYNVSKHERNALLRLIKNFFVTGYDIRKWSKNIEKGDFVLFNALRIGQTLGALYNCKRLGLTTVAIITDLPGYRINQGKFNLADYIGQKIIKKFDYYILLSEEMRKVMEIDSDRTCIIEGIFDENTIQGITVKRSRGYFTVMYAGSLHYKYGIMELVKAIEMIPDKNIRLKIYGRGEASNEIREIAKKDSRICFEGEVSHEEILIKEVSVDLLVNPRPVDEEYVKYSFPSKNMEYMASGTPVLLTEIPSLPSEYKEYVTLVANNKAESLAEEITKIKRHWDENDNFYYNKADEARQFIVENKNCIQQTKKIIELLEGK